MCRERLVPLIQTHPEVPETHEALLEPPRGGRAGEITPARLACPCCAHALRFADVPATARLYR